MFALLSFKRWLYSQDVIFVSLLELNRLETQENKPSTYLHLSTSMINIVGNGFILLVCGTPCSYNSPYMVFICAWACFQRWFLWRAIGLYNHFVSIVSLPPQGDFKQQKLLLHDKAILWVLPVYMIVFHSKEGRRLCIPAVYACIANQSWRRDYLRTRCHKLFELHRIGHVKRVAARDLYVSYRQACFSIDLLVTRMAAIRIVH